MITTRDCVREYLLAREFNTVVGQNKKAVQYQGEDEGEKWFGLYDENGDWENETPDIEEALNYLDLGGAKDDAD